jgi:hypothetical protein
MKKILFIMKVLITKLFCKSIAYFKALLDPQDINTFTSLIGHLFEKANLLLKYAIGSAWGNLITRRGITWFIRCHYRFWIRSAPLAKACFALGIFY